MRKRKGLILSEEEWADGMQGMYGVGDGDGESTFRVPDFRGQFLRCADDLKGIDVNRSVIRYKKMRYATLWENSL